MGKEGSKEGKARRYQRGGGNPAGFNHRPTRRRDRRDSPSASYSLAPPPPRSEKVSKLLSSAELPRDGVGGGRGSGELARGASDRRYADRAYLELADASQSIYLAKAPLDRCPGLTPPRYLPPRQRGSGTGAERMRSYVDERAHTRTPRPQTAAEKINFRFAAIYNFL